MIFQDREEAGRRLAAELGHLVDRPDVVVVGLPRGGVPVAAKVAEALRVPLDVIVVRKLGVPYQPELAMGAVGEGGVRVIDDTILRMAHVSADELAAVDEREHAELVRRAERFRRGRPRVRLGGRHVVVVDDGIATGSTMRAACAVARAEGATRITVAVPVAPADWTRRLAGIADEYVAVDTPSGFRAVGQFYRDFRQTTDDEVVAILASTKERRGSDPLRQDDLGHHGDAAGEGLTPSVPLRQDDLGHHGDAAGEGLTPSGTDEEVEIRVDEASLGGHLMVPPHARGLVVFAHGSGSSRHSPRNRYVAHVLEDAGLATLLFDLLTADEERSRANVFDVDLLAHRLSAVTDRVRRQPDLETLRIGYFGASTGAAAALRAAAAPDCDVRAVVSRGGRPDLAGAALGSVRAPTLLIVGGHDTAVLGLNRRAQAELRCPNELAVVPGATHLFEEPGTLHAAAELARDWFVRHLADGPPDDRPTSVSSSGAISPA